MTAQITPENPVFYADLTYLYSSKLPTSLLLWLLGFAFVRLSADTVSQTGLHLVPLVELEHYAKQIR